MAPDDLERYETFLADARRILKRDGRANEILRVEHRVAEAIRQEVPFAAFSGEDSNLPATRDAIVPEIVSEPEVHVDGIAALDELLSIVSERIEHHAGRSGWFSRHELAKAEKNLKLLVQHLSSAGDAVAASRRIVEERTALAVALINHERQLVAAEKDLINAHLERDRSQNHERFRDETRKKEEEESRLRWEHVIEELRALSAEARARVAVAEATMRDLAEPPADLPSVTVDDLRKKGR